MKSIFTLTPSESKRLIAKAVIEMEEIKQAKEKGYIVICVGTTNAFIIQELLGLNVQPQTFAAGLNTQGLLCVTNPEDRHARIDKYIILHKGEVVDIDIQKVFEDFHIETVVIKGANAIDPEGNVGIITSGFDGGITSKFIGYVTSTGLKLIVPVGLEKLVVSVKEAAQCMGAKTFNYSMGANVGMWCLANVKVVTEIQALKILADVEAKHVASGGIGGSEGAVVLVIMGNENNIKKAIYLIESIKGEKPVGPLKGTCEKCRYTCKFQGKRVEELPSFLK